MAIGLPIAAIRVQPRQHVAFGGDVDAGEHDPSVMCQRPGASEPASMLTLVQARTQLARPGLGIPSEP